MASAKNENEYTLMVEYDFNKPITATIIFDSDEDESNQEINSRQPEKHDRDLQKVPKSLDMPSLDGHNSRTEVKLDDVVTKVIKQYICKTKKASDKKPSKRKYSTTSETKKLKRKNKNENLTEIRSQHNDQLCSSPKKNCQVASNQLGSSAEASGDVSNDIRSQNDSYNTHSPSNTANQQPISAYIEPKAEPTEDTNPSSYLSREITSRQNTYTDNDQPGYTFVDQQVEPVLDSQTSSNITSEGIRNPLDTSTSSSPTKSYDSQPIFACIELKAQLIGDSNPQSCFSYEITNKQPISSESNSQLNTNDRQSIPTCIEKKVKSGAHSRTSVNEVLQEMSNMVKKIDYQSNIPISSVPPNTDNSCSVTNEIRNEPNNSSSTSLTNTNNIQPVSSDITSKSQMQQNNDNSGTYDHLKPLLDTVSEHLILIMKRTHSCFDILNDKYQQNLGFQEELRKKIYKYKIRLFDLSYSTVVNVILPRACDKTFVKNFIDNTVALSKCDNRQTTKEISILYLEMINWVKKMKQQITSESVFENEIRQPLAPKAAAETDTSGLPRSVKESSNPHSTYNYTYSIGPPETQRSPQWNARNYLPPPYTYNNNLPRSSYTNNLLPPYTNNIPQYYSTIPPQTCVNNVITPEQTKMANSMYNEHQQLPTKPTQKTKGKLNQKQVTVSEVAKRAVNSTDGPRQDLYSSNITQVKNTNNNHNINVLSNQAGNTYQNYYQPTYLPTCLNTPHAQNVYNINNNLSANNSPNPKAAAESEYQKFLSVSRPRNLLKYNMYNENQNHRYRASDTSSQETNNYPINASQIQAQANDNIQQESDRSSISRDSGFYSPREFVQEPSTSPLITHVTSLNPDAVNIIKGSCFVCGKSTNQKCVGCYAIYYCSYGCQVKLKKGLAFDLANEVKCKCIQMKVDELCYMGYHLNRILTGETI